MKTIIEMARKYTVGGLEFDAEGLERFVNDVRADEREENAKVCEEQSEIYAVPVTIADYQQMWNECAAAIRARGNT